MNSLFGTFNQEKALIEAFSVIVITDGSFAALVNGDRNNDIDDSETDRDRLPGWIRHRAGARPRPSWGTGTRSWRASAPSPPA